MGKRDDLIAQYAEDLSGKCGVTPDMDLLTKVTIGCGPAIYSADSALVAGSDPTEHETIRKNFLIKRLGLSDGRGSRSLPSSSELVRKRSLPKSSTQARWHALVVGKRSSLTVGSRARLSWTRPLTNSR